ncbi:MAG: PAS domain-containing sensor histidine kinase [Bacteroidota bacterium]
MKRDKANKGTIIKTVGIDLPKIDFRSKYKRLLSANRQLNQRKEELELVFAEIEDIYNHAPCGYYSLDKNGVFVRINDTALRWLDAPRSAFAGRKNITDILTEDSKEVFEKNYPVFIKTGAIRDVELELVRSDGSSLPVLMNATAVYDQDGNYKMSRSVILDFTERRLKERESRHSHTDLQHKNDALTIANENLFFLNREKDRFMDIASHDLQLPLAAISMLSETLLKKNIESGSLAVEQVIEMIHEGSLEMKSLLANYLSASTAETGHMDLFLKETDINELTNDIVNRYLPIAAKKNIQLHFKNNKNFLLFTDRECCTQIIENLLSNAVKYTAPGKNITVAITGNQKEAKIIIADEGQGIRKEDHHLLFQRFQKLSARPTGGELSTGLGLSIVKYLVEQLKGYISVESEVGKGSVFTVHLPISNEI